MTGDQIRDLRHQLNLSQIKFAERYDIGLVTLRQWEQGRRTPSGCANVLLQLIKREPKMIAKILAR